MGERKESIWTSLRLYIKAIIGGVYSNILIIFVGSIGLYNSYIMPFLSSNYQLQIDVPPYIIIVVCLFILLLKSFKAYHNIRIIKLKELYSLSPETKSDHAFRELFKLYVYGELLKSANAERRSRWDEDVKIYMNEYFNEAIREVYLLNTGRNWGHTLDPIPDDKYDRAISIIKEHVYDNDFNRFLK